MGKTLNILLFWPGHAGHFLQFLLSLDDKTYPIHHPDVDINTITSRKDTYSFKNAIWKHNGWGKFHISFLKNQSHLGTEYSRIHNCLNSKKHDTYTTIVSPRNLNEMMTKIQNEFMERMTHVNYLIVDLSPNMEFVIDDFKKNNDNYPSPPGVPHPVESQIAYDNFKSQYSPYVIKLDNLFYGQDIFIEEYTKLNNHLNLPLHIQDAQEMYAAWYRERRIGRLNIAKPQ